MPAGGLREGGLQRCLEGRCIDNRQKVKRGVTEYTDFFFFFSVGIVEQGT